MRVSRHSWHFRYYCFWKTCTHHDGLFTFFELALRRRSIDMDDLGPRSLCSYFWFCVLATLVAPFVLVLTVVFTVVIVPAAWPIIKVHDRNERLRREGKKPEKQDGMIRTFVKAKKEKVCPLIEVVD